MSSSDSFVHLHVHTEYSMLDGAARAVLQAGRSDRRILVLGADHDAAGIAAAQVCADRWAAAGAEVRVIVPPKPKQDLNDLVLEAE